MASAETDFGIRTLSGERAIVRVGEHQKVGQRDSSAVQARVAQGASAGASWARLKSGSGNLSAAAGMGSRWGRVTSTYRTPKHNRRVGGVRNSYHLSGRAIDIARRPGVSHAQIAAAFRNEGERGFAIAEDAKPMRGRSSNTSVRPRVSPSTVTVPDVGCISVSASWSSVVLPAPLGPRITHR